MAQITKQPVGELWRIKRAAMDAFDFISAQVKAGDFEFFSIGGAFFVTTAEIISPEKKELVIVCAEGEQLAQGAKVIYDAAQRLGYTSVRIHAFRRGIVRILKDFDFKQAETVYRLQL